MKRSIAILFISAFFSFTAFAQQSKPSPSDTAQSLTLKEKWTKHYNEINTQLDEYLAKLKVEGSDHPEFTEAVNKLDKMMTAFKEEIDKWDIATKDQRANYSDELKEDFKKLKAQEEKVKTMWNKMNANMKKKNSGEHG
ncbi:MAG TPA: hypothetical protein VE978_23450 [Chitinophagales bacterium]|nr:hypothetical protein [Chitinophagales bacterium]